MRDGEGSAVGEPPARGGKRNGNGNRNGADVAKAVRAIADGLLDYATGQILNVDGGFHLRGL